MIEVLSVPYYYYDDDDDQHHQCHIIIIEGLIVKLFKWLILVSVFE